VTRPQTEQVGAGFRVPVMLFCFQSALFIASGSVFRLPEYRFRNHRMDAFCAIDCLRHV